MATRERRRRPRVLYAVAVVLALLALTTVAYRAGRTPTLEPYVGPVAARAERALGLDGDSADLADPAEQPSPPAQVAPSDGSALTPVLAPPTVAAAIDGTATTPLPRALRRAVTPALRSGDLGGRVLALVTDLTSGEEVFRSGRGTAIPASTTKLLSVAAALQALGPEATFSTRVIAGGPGTVVLVGGGDPFLERSPSDPADPDAAPYPPRADLTTLAQQVASALAAGGTTTVAVGYDDALFAGPTVNPAWRADYVPDGVVSPITALWTDEGRPVQGFGRVADPSLAAARDFAAALRAAGITVTGVPTRGVAAPGGQVLGEVSSAPLREIGQRVLEVSDNEAAEVLAHQVALARGLPGSFADGAAAVTATLTEVGVPTDGLVLTDGSGLSRRNRIAPETLTGLLRAATDPDHPRLDTLLADLPVAGFTGSLTSRFAQEPAGARGVVRAKTGTLTGVGSLAGLVVDATGHPYAFALMADRVRAAGEVVAEAALDATAAAIATCSCSAPPAGG